MEIERIERKTGGGNQVNQVCGQRRKFKDAVINEELEKIMCPEFVKYGVLEYKKSEGADDVKDAVIHGKVERIMCSEFEVQLDNGHQKTEGIIWTMGKVLTGSVFDGGGD